MHPLAVFPLTRRPAQLACQLAMRYRTAAIGGQAIRLSADCKRPPSATAIAWVRLPGASNDARLAASRSEPQADRRLPSASCHPGRSR